MVRGGEGTREEGRRRKRGEQSDEAATQQGGSFNKHELELGAIERCGRKAYANEGRPNEEKRERGGGGVGRGRRRRRERFKCASWSVNTGWFQRRRLAGPPRETCQRRHRRFEEATTVSPTKCKLPDPVRSAGRLDPSSNVSLALQSAGTSTFWTNYSAAFLPTFLFRCRRLRVRVQTRSRALCCRVCVCVRVQEMGAGSWRKKAVYLEQRIMGQLPVACWKRWGGCEGRARNHFMEQSHLSIHTLASSRGFLMHGRTHTRRQKHTQAHTSSFRNIEPPCAKGLSPTWFQKLIHQTMFFPADVFFPL